MVNACVYLLASGILQQLPKGEFFSFEQQLLVPRVDELQPLAFHAEGYFIDISIPEDFKLASQMIALKGETLVLHIRTCSWAGMES